VEVVDVLGDETLQPVPTGSAGVLRVGEVVSAGRYRITRFLAAGGMGEVYEAEDLIVGGTIALKTLRDELSASADAVDGLRREIALARKVTHANVCRLHDVGEHAGRVFLTMELLAGTTLAAHLATSGPLPVEELDRISAQLVTGLGALHAAGIVHGDFKTSNVMLVDGRAVITDFGLARATTERDPQVTSDAALRGTPAYMAPEQVEGRPPTPASDIYALGVVLFELATGRVPFREDTALATATARLHKAPPDPRALRRNLPPRWRKTISSCLARDPARRPDGEDLVVRPRRTLRRWVLAVIALVVAIVGFVAFPRDTPAPAKLPGHMRFVPHGERVAKLYRAAMERYLRDDRLGAYARLEEAAALGPSDPIVLGRFASVMFELGFVERAERAIDNAIEASSSLDEEARLWLEATHAVIHGRNADATTRLARLIAIAPTELEYRAMMFRALVDPPAPERAADALAALREFHGVAGDALYEICAARLAAIQRDIPGLQTHAEAARTHARRGSLKDLEATAELELGTAQFWREDLAEAKLSLERAVAMYSITGNALGLLHARKLLADVAQSEGHFLRTADQYEAILAIVRPLGARRLLLDVLAESGSAFVVAGRVEQARAALDEAIELARALGHREQLAMALFMRGRVSQITGALDEARAKFQECDVVARELGDIGLRKIIAFNMAAVATELDDEEAYQHWIAAAGEPTGGEVALMLPFRRGEVAEARQRWETLRTRPQATLSRGQIDAFIAWADAREGKISEAKERFDRVRPLFSEGIFISAALIDSHSRAVSGDVSGGLALLDAKSHQLAAAGAVWYQMFVDAEAVDIATAANDSSAASRRSNLVMLAHQYGFRRRVRELSREDLNSPRTVLPSTHR
jgi:tetratricopeptide (TPR) repeat protein